MQPALLLVFIFFYNILNVYSAEVLVKPTSVTSVEFFDQYNSIGQYKKIQSRDYTAQVSGIVHYTSHKQGMPVKSGDVLLKIDHHIAESIKSQAQTDFEDAKLSHIRDQNLFKKKFISDEVLHKSLVNLETKKLMLDKALKTYDDMVITAPFDGELGVIKAIAGNRVNPGDYLFSIIAKSGGIIFVELPESLYGKVDQTTELFITNNDNKVMGKIDSISDYLSDSGTITTKILVDDDQLIYGSYVNVTFIINKHKGLGVPESAVMQNDDGSFVYKINDDNTIKSVYVDLGTRTANMIEIISDNITLNDKVVLEGLTKVRDGLEVSILD